MALERNKTALQFEPGIDPEFEQMLRHHLKRGGAPVAACSGFDADTASAFIENALAESARSRYQSHLAGCPACRHHLIELSRLPELPRPVQTIPGVDPIFVSNNEREPVRAKWRTTVKEWLDLSIWRPFRWNWPAAALATAGIMVVIGVVTVKQWQRFSRPEQAEVAMQPGVSTEAGIAASSRLAPNGSESSAPASGNAPAPDSESMQADKSVSNLYSEAQPPLRTSPIPLPSVRPKQNESALISGASPRLEKELSSREVVVALPPVTSFSTAPGVPLSLRSDGPAASMTSVGIPSLSSQDVALAPQSSANIVERQVGPSPDDNPMRAGSESTEEIARAKKTERATSKPSLLERARAFAPGRKNDRDAKPLPVRIDDERMHMLTHRIQNRIFHYQDGVWVDHEYKPEMQWRVTKLVRGTEEFDRVLKEEPELKPFFEKESIIVIWHDKIYKVVPK